MKGGIRHTHTHTHAHTRTYTHKHRIAGTHIHTHIHTHTYTHTYTHMHTHARTGLSWKAMGRFVERSGNSGGEMRGSLMQSLPHAAASHCVIVKSSTFRCCGV